MDSACVSPQPKPQISGLAIASLVLSCLAVIPIPGPLGAVLGIVFGYSARWQIRKHPRISGDGVVLAGLIVGYTFLVLYLFTIITLLFLFCENYQPDDLRLLWR